ncbi:MAG: septum formation inhibitor Maf [Vicingaceae bacterium]|nr:septum formation inhibitor Maf [Vicingaceae bacterium]
MKTILTLRRFLKNNILLPLSVVMIPFLFACNFISSENKEIATEQPSTAFNNYWFNNEAEITSYKLEQARYGEIRQGNAVLIYVTEPFSKKKQVKADNPTPNDFSVLKLNFTKKFNTGIYPYSMMNSLFLPIDDLSKPLIKATSSAQEWCGHAFTQLNQKNNKWNINSFSYFESEGDNTSFIPNDVLEDEIWLRIRTNPEMLPTGKTKLIPSLFYVRLMHKELKAYRAEISSTSEKNITTYTIYYPELERTLTIHYQNVFPYAIESWEETYVSGWGDKAQKLTTKAIKINTLKNAYWTKNAVKDSLLRKELGL